MLFTIVWIIMACYSFLTAVMKGKNVLFWFIFSFAFPYIALFVTLALEPDEDSMYDKAGWNYRGEPRDQIKKK